MELDATQRKKLELFLKEQSLEVPEKPGLTDITIHVIDVGANSSVKQHCYLVSPKAIEVLVAEIEQMLTDDIENPQIVNGPTL